MESSDDDLLNEVDDDGKNLMESLTSSNLDGEGSIRKGKVFSHVFPSFYVAICSSIQVIFLVILALLSIMVVIESFQVNTTSVFPDEYEPDNSIISKVYDLSENIAKLLGINSDPPSELPSLIVQITVDQLRSDLMFKYRKRFIKNEDKQIIGGFDFLMKNGVLYRNARYRHARTVTPVGHATLITGGVPYSHGIVSHYFLDPILNKVVFSIENENYPETNGNEEIRGSAPTYLESTTTGDELLIFSNVSKMFSVSVKDKPAIICAGRLGKSFWLSEKTGKVISSTFFYKDKYPNYVTEWNSKNVISSYLENKYWELSYPKNIYHFQNRKYGKPTNGKEFPKPYFNHNNTEDFINGLIDSPAGDRIMWDFTKKLIIEEELGKRKNDENGSEIIIDMISISLSSVDKVGHTCGPNSIEGEDTIYKTDELLNDIFEFLDEHIGLTNCLIALSADHGGEMDWQQIRDIGFDNEPLYSEENIDILEQFLNETVFGGELLSPVILGWKKVNIYFHHDVIKQHGKTINEVQDVAAEWLMESRKEVLFAFTKHDLSKGFVPKTKLGEAVLLNFHPERSGDVMIIMKEFTRMEIKEKPDIVLRHGTSWIYDTFIPIVFVGENIPKGIVVDRLVTPEDVAPTISAYYGFNPPSGNVGNNLREVLINHDVSYFMN